VNSNKTIHSRSNKEIGDVIETEWEITAKKVIAEPRPADGNGPPRFGIYEYQVKAIQQAAPIKLARGSKQAPQPSVGGTRREASSVPLTVRRSS
jgi:hypothetical protein